MLSALVVVGAALGVAAQTSLYIPGFDPQPVSANVLGVGSDGRTTWQIQPGQPSGTLSDVGFIGTATLVEGPNDAQLYLSNDAMYLSEACTLHNGLADCTVVASAEGSTVTETAQETASPFPVQVGDAGSAPTPTPAPSSPSPSAPSSPSRSSSNSAPSQTGSPAPTASGQPSGAMRTVSGAALVALVGVGAVLALL